MKLQPPPKVKIIETISKFINGLEETPRKVLLGGLIFFFIMAASTTLLLAYYVYQSQVDAFFQKATLTPITTITPTSSTTPQCIRPSLTLGNTDYPLDLLSIKTPGVLPAPSGAAGTAWWVSETFSPFVFILTPPLGSPDLSSTLAPGAAMLVQWADCGREEFVFTDLKTGAPDAKDLLAQAKPGIAVVIQPIGTAVGYVLYGQRPEPLKSLTPEPTLEQTQEPTQGLTPELTLEQSQEPTHGPTQEPTSEPSQEPTPEPSPNRSPEPTREPTQEPTKENAVIIDITFEDMIFSNDRQTLQISLTITNRGSQAITITNDDLSLAAENQSPEAPLQVVPALSQELQPGASLPLVITFANPGGQYAVLRVFDTTLDLFY